MTRGHLNLLDAIYFCIGQAIYEATCRGRFGVGGSSRWRDAQALLWIIGHELRSREYSEGRMQLR